MTRLPQFPDNKPLTDEQRHFAAGASAARHAAVKEFENRTYDANLRKWCIEMAIKASGPPGALAIDAERQPVGHVDFAVVSLAKDIFEFVSEPPKDEAR